MMVGCTLRDVWEEVRDATISLLGGVTFADLAKRAGRCLDRPGADRPGAESDAVYVGTTKPGALERLAPALLRSASTKARAASSSSVLRPRPPPGTRSAVERRREARLPVRDPRPASRRLRRRTLRRPRRARPFPQHPSRRPRSRRRCRARPTVRASRGRFACSRPPGRLQPRRRASSRVAGCPRRSRSQPGSPRGTMSTSRFDANVTGSSTSPSSKSSCGYFELAAA